ncbi:sugar ABC transporter permease [Ktedonobacter sp. SOSP1-85]|uniref:carbohydrate ABC transporter permease n=1 Tax=Ktedonobacter sp. SOSP1-85 TaxID=2778367 RepID=UPI00191673FD|nr:sugar ABC transporter permease [Ktedonobacter sp. SOSP1-85]GHO79833.1 sugar ABC transporter permease [Ktedonobacter sp. SOSP1-85]
MATHIQEQQSVVRGNVPKSIARRSSRSRLVRFSFLVPVIIYLLIFFGYPLYYSISVSLEKYTLQTEYTGNAPFIGLSNYIAVLQDATTGGAALHTLIFTVGSIVPQFVIGLALAVFFTKKFPLSRFLRSLMLLPWLLPLVVSGTVWRWLFDQTNGIIDQTLAGLHLIPAHFGWLTTPGYALATIIVTNIWIGIPFNMVLLYSGLQGIPGELYEAASIDSATQWQRFWYVTLPLLRPVIGVVLMLGLIYTLKVFDIVYVMTGGGPANTTQIFATWSYNLSFAQQLFGQGSALGNVILVISLVVALFYVRANRQQDA